MEESAAPALWLTITLGVVSALVVSVLAHALLQMPAVRVKAYTDAVMDASSNVRFHTYVVVTNLRGRPVTIDPVLLMRRRQNWVAPAEWRTAKLLPARLEEGDTVKLDVPSELAEGGRFVPFAGDAAGRVWPRRRRPRVWINRLRGPMLFAIPGRPLSARRRRRVERKFARARQRREARGE